MFLKSALSLLAATTVAAAPSTNIEQRQSTPSIHVTLTAIDNTLAVTADFDLSRDGTSVPVDSNLLWTQADITCIEICIPEYHCTLYDEDLNPAVTLPPGSSSFPGTKVGQITCGDLLPEEKRAPEPAAVAVDNSDKRQSTPSLSVTLTGRDPIIKPLFIEEFNLSTDGTPVAVTSTHFFFQASIGCIYEICILEHSCTFYNKDLVPFVTLGPGGGSFPDTQVGQITCSPFLSADLPVPAVKRGHYTLPVEPWPTARAVASRDDAAPAVAARASYVGTAVFTNEETGDEAEFPFVLDQVVELGSSAAYFTNATVREINAPFNVHWGCRAYDTLGEDLGLFYASDRFIYSFRPGVVGSFVC